jgi:phage terminase large subunit
MKQTTALRKIAGMRNKYRIVRGGQGAGKTIAILMLIANTCSSNAGRRWVIASEELTKMKETVIRDFVTVLSEFGIFSEKRFNRTESLYTFPNGSTVKFLALDKDDVGKGYRTHGVYFNEVNKTTFEAFNQLASRSQLVFADYNPDAPFFIDDEVLTRDDCSYLQLTYKDNELLGVEERREIESYYTRGYNDKGEVVNEYWANKWQVYGCGNVGSLTGAIYKNWEVVNSIPEGARLKGGGLDFGFTNDPTALISVYEQGGDLILDQECYATDMLNDDIAAAVRGSILALSTIYADSAEPKTIKELKSKHRLRVVGADKGSDSVRYGIDQLQRRRILVTARSRDLINELRNYTWQVDRNGKPTNKPIDKHNHALDAVRYYILGKGKYTGRYMVA